MNNRTKGDATSPGRGCWHRHRARLRHLAVVHGAALCLHHTAVRQNTSHSLSQSGSQMAPPCGPTRRCTVANPQSDGALVSQSGRQSVIQVEPPGGRRAALSLPGHSQTEQQSVISQSVSLRHLTLHCASQATIRQNSSQSSVSSQSVRWRHQNSKANCMQLASDRRF